jgi:alkylation response protein AidB-like acyl-CoA dehydrogenase
MSGTTTDAATLLSRRDLRFLLHEWLRVEELCGRERYAEHSREVFDDVLELAERLAAEQFAPHNREADEQEPHLDAEGRVVLVDAVAPALEAFAEAGFIGLSMPAEVGGLGLPHTVANACMAYFMAANPGTSGYPFLTTAAANLLLVQGSQEQVETWVPQMVEGRCFGTMCISETQAGSSVGDLTTRAVPQDDGSFRLFGSKMWISGGDQEVSENIVHLVLARLPDAPAGSKGVSLFLVPKVLADGTRNDVVLAGLNHKMGYRGTVNTVLGFGEGVHRPGGEAGAVGWLVGEAGKGLRGMFHMMNEARLGVGMGAAAIGATGFLRSLRYARERVQGRPLGAGPETPQVPIVEHADVRRMLLAQKAYAEGAMALLLFCARLLDDEQSHPDPDARERAALLLGMLTPIAKSWPSQWCLEANSLAIQVLGGYGYAREYGVEQLYRDNRLNPIHEGTHGIQALDLLGRKVPAGGGAGLAALLGAVHEACDRAEAAGGVPAELAPALRATAGRVGEVTGAVWGQGDPQLALANATAYLEAVGHVVVAWMWLEQATAAEGGEEAVHHGKRAAARFFFAHELPKAGPQLDLLAALDRTVLDLDDAWL